ncbi:MAG: riboflavin synthase subunit alpha [Gammaproteobacteria bacterium]|jgi:riboflavin synthase|nr:riboflavin synthase subunit alpha [Gammaproteobacteria bacterium]
MFTGIVQSTAKIASIAHDTNLTRYTIDMPIQLVEGLTLGASVSINGACQTVVAINGTLVSFDAIAETLRCTTIPTFQNGQRVNIERSAKLGDEIGGHLLSGHIIGTGTMSNIIHLSSEQCVLTIQCNPEWIKYILFKGYIALNGVSLTVQEVFDEHFCVHLIPETLRITTFGQAKEGEHLNIEIDSQTQAIVDTVERVLASRKL